MTRNGTKGPCCLCGKRGRLVRNIVMLAFKAGFTGPGTWGCVVCGIEGGAVAAICDPCAVQMADSAREFVQVLRFILGPSMTRVPLPAEFVPIQHIREKHPEEDWPEE